MRGRNAMSYWNLENELCIVEVPLSHGSLHLCSLSWSFHSSLLYHKYSVFVIHVNLKQRGDESTVSFFSPS